MLQQATEQVGPLCGEDLEESLDRMRRGRALDICFDDGCIAGVFGQNIEVDQVATGAVEEEAEKLYLINGRAIGVLAHGAEEVIDVVGEANSTNVASKEVESGPTCQTVVRDLDIVYEFCFGSL